jgi:NADPH:quinone reductase-like Zn-dependent oxidoreductase
MDTTRPEVAKAAQGHTRLDFSMGKPVAVLLGHMAGWAGADDSTVMPVPAGTSNGRNWSRAIVHGDSGVMAHVLVTGGTGFLGSHTIARLLASGHKVTTTLRSSKRQPDVERMLSMAEAPERERVSYVEADLTSDAG